MSEIETKYFTNRHDWRKWLQNNFETKEDIWLEYPKKETGKKRILYNDAVEEALCFGWIDTTVKSLNKETTIQRFCKRRNNASYSQANKERLKHLLKSGLIHRSIFEEIEKVTKEKFVFSGDIVDQLKTDKQTWENFQKMSEPYKRIRIAYIESARKRPGEFVKRLNNFMAKTKENKMIKGFGGIEKYY
ncbi:MAG: YdeI/OmpD-associated family protein [Prolixibacteraceae bacterium]|nr:YdeI/OmpD-associated family protein [Prolixibacteraceae bacterium]